MKYSTPEYTGRSVLWFNQGCSIGCEKCTGTGKGCSNPTKPTITEKEYMTGYNGYRPTTNPWGYPGSAPVEDPCGLAGGWYVEGSLGNGGDAPPGVPQGTSAGTSPKASKLLEQTEWISGSTVEVAWWIDANHGGGYQYRLCPADSKLTEECFSQTPLDFVGGTQWLQYGGGTDTNNRTEIPAVTVSGDKVLPAGSTWRRNPIPACTGGAGGAIHAPCMGPLFESPIPGGMGEAYGFGGGSCNSGIPGTSCPPDDFKVRTFDFGMVDKVRVPDVPPGDYVLSFRWDSEQTPQVWASCADVTIKSSGTSTKPFTPLRGCTPCCNVGHICANCSACVDDKTGDCAYCWKVLGQTQLTKHKTVPALACLGYEDDNGHAPVWHPGDEVVEALSPGCTSCWADEDACKPTARETEGGSAVV